MAAASSEPGDLLEKWPRARTEPPNWATETAAGRGVFWGLHSQSPVRIHQGSTAKTPRNRGIFKGYSWPRAGILCIKRLNGGESGIRTHGTLSGTHAFQACAFNHSAISPENLGFSERKAPVRPPSKAGGEGGIRTLDELLTHTPLAGERLQPLGHLSKTAEDSRGAGRAQRSDPPRVSTTLLRPAGRADVPSAAREPEAESDA